jgi:biotin synthase
MAQALTWYRQPLLALLAQANGVRRAGVGDTLDLCTIINARSGRCPEDCQYCAQSAHYQTTVEEYPLRDVETLVAAARQARAIGSGRFGIVTSGNTLDAAELTVVIEAVARITREVGIDVCGSLGALTRDQLAQLRDAGLTRYHHNIETSRRYYAHIVSTHTFDDRLRTIRDAAAVGLSVCSGGIIGMGETVEDRLDMALTLRDLPVESIPINILTPIPGTPLAELPMLDPVEALRTIAVFRLLMPERTIKLAAGRETVLRDYQGAAFLGGANAMIIGGYLTTRGRAVEDDHRLIVQVLRSWEE